MGNSETLIEDIREVFRRSGQSTLFTAELIGHLAAVPGGPWSALTARRLGALLAAHDIVPGPVRRGEVVRRGYHRRRFLEPLHVNEDTKCAELAEASAATNGSGPAGQRSGPPAEDGQNDQIKAPPEASDPSPDPAAEAWRQRFIEQVARVLRNPARTEHEAVVITFHNLVQAWIRCNPFPQADQTRCVQCGQPENNAGLIMFGTPAFGLTPLHPACWSGWHQKREAQAVEELARYGISRHGLTGRRETPNGAKTARSASRIWSAAAAEEND
jgi:hypothetical protein